MNNLLHFIINHWTLWAALVVLVILLIIEETKTVIQGVAKISASKVVELINHDNAIVIDVRQSSQFNTGHIIGSMNIASNEIENNINKLIKYKDQPVVVVCNVGQSSIKAGAILKKHGFTKIFSLAGGIAEWQKANLPLTKQ